MMALAFSLLALGMWNNRKPYLAGILAGLGLLSGPAVIQGGLGIGIAWLAFRWINTDSKRLAPPIKTTDKQALKL